MIFISYGLVINPKKDVLRVGVKLHKYEKVINKCERLKGRHHAEEKRTQRERETDRKGKIIDI